MKSSTIQNRVFASLKPAILSACLFLLAGRVTAQTLSTLHSFSGSDGARPFAGLALSGNTLYGTAVNGGSSDDGTVFAINIDGTGFTTLHSFTSSDGAFPVGGLILSGNTLYGTANLGGNSGGFGTVFAVNIDGTGFTTVHSFTGSEAAYPFAGLVLSGNTLYGTTYNGGIFLNPGTVFAVNTDGSDFTTLHSISRSSDGANPQAGLILSGNTLYGTASSGGSSFFGTVFAVNTDGSGFTTLHSFSRSSDGASPQAGLILSGNTLYGTASGGPGLTGNGTVFAVNTDGTGFTTLHSFNGGDGAYPSSGLILSGNTLYGMAYGGGSSGNGTVFAVNIDGTEFTTLYSFNGGDGGGPVGGLSLLDNTLYGTATSGGSSGNGTVFKLTLGVPAIRCPANIVTGNDPGQCSAVVNYSAAATDGFGHALAVTCLPASGTVFPKGTTTVTCTAAGGLSCGFTVTVNDTEKPVIACPANITLGCSIDSLATVSFAATAQDNCDPNPTLTYSPQPGSGFPVGTTTVTCTATDSSGNQSSCGFTVTRAPLDFTGFLSPIGGADATGGSFASPVRTFKLNSTIPVKFTSACGGTAVLSGIHRLEVIKYADQTTSGTAIDATPTDAATTGDEFRLNGGQWQFNLDTKAGMSTGIWLLRATLSDGSQHDAWIQIK